MGTVQLVAVVPPELLNHFVENRSLQEFDVMPSLSPLVTEVIRRFIKDNVGFDNSPIACLSNYDGEPAELSKVWKHVDEILSAKVGSSLWQVAMPSDMIVTVDVVDLLEISEETKGMSIDDEDADLYIDDVKKLLKLGYREGEETISFIPYLELKRCKVAALIGSNWENKAVAIKELQKYDIKMLNIF